VVDDEQPLTAASPNPAIAPSTPRRVTVALVGTCASYC
jgi:hypothetical protein